MKKAIYVLLLLLVISCLNAGCVERKLTIKSNPPGANVYFNDKQVGKTPVDFDFKWYWTHKVRLEKNGYASITNYETIKAPSYMWIPFDLVAEILPFKIRDYRNLIYDLEPKRQIEEKTKQEIKKEEVDFNK